MLQMETVRHLHVLSSQLIRLRRSLTPLLHVIYIIRDQDAQRSRAASALAGTPRPPDKTHMSRDTHWLAPSSPGIETSSVNSWIPGAGIGQGQGQGNAQEQGFFSSMTKVYIGDVLDHLEIVVSSLDQFVATCDHLTDYVFVSPFEGEWSFELMVDGERLVVPDERIDGAAEYRHGRLPS